jgi:hypothetical protein
MKYLSYYLILSLAILTVSCKNKLTVNIEDVDTEDFLIYFQAPLIDSTRVTIFKDGQLLTSNPPNIEGEKFTSWCIIYKDSLKCSFKHFRSNWYNRYKGDIRIFLDENTLYCECNFKGEKEFDNNYLLQFEPIEESK